MPMIEPFQVHLNKAMAILGDVKSLDRAFLTDPAVLRALANQELEQNLTYDSMQTQPAYRKVLEHLHPDEFQPDPNDRDVRGRQNRFNSNGLRKLSSGITINATAAIMLAGLRVDEEAGTQKDSAADRDIEIAVMLHDVMGRRALDTAPHQAPSLDDTHRRVIDDEFIREHFSDNVLRHVKGLNTSLSVLDSGNPEAVAPEYANAVAAIAAVRVREAAKIVSCQLLERMQDDIRQAFCAENGLTSGEPAQELLDREFAKLQSVLKRTDIAAEVRAPIEQTLVPAIEDYRRTGDGKKLVGSPEKGNGTAYAAFNQALPINRYKTVEEREGKFVDYTDLDVYKMLMMQVRYHQDTLRKDGSSIFSHVLDTIGVGANALGDNLRNLVTIVLGLHDSVEDGGREVAAFNLDTSMIAKTFGKRMTLLIAEMTDYYGKKNYGERASMAYNAGRRHQFVEETIKSLEEQQVVPVAEGIVGESYIQRYLETTPFNLATAGAKIADIVSTARKSLETPEVNQGFWRNSGARVAWLVESKGYAGDLYQAIADHVENFFKSPNTHNRLESGHNEKELNLGLLNFLSATKATLDQYTLQSLTIIADEFGLDARQRETFRDKFMDTRGVSNTQFQQYMAENLVLPEGAQALSAISPAACDQKTGVNMTTLHDKSSKPGAITPQYDKILALRHQFSRREMSRNALNATLNNTAVSDHDAMREALTRATSQSPQHFHDMDRTVVSRYDGHMGIEKPRRARPELGIHTIVVGQDIGPVVNQPALLA